VESEPWRSLTLAGPTKEDKEQFIHKLWVTLNRLVGLVVT
jgi:hypothetical protein